MAEDKRKELSADERRKIQKQRKLAAKEAQKFHKNQAKAVKSSNNKENIKKEDVKKQGAPKKPKTAPSQKAAGSQRAKSSKPVKKTNSKIEQKLNEQMKKQRDDLSQEERFIRKSEKKIKNLKPKAYDDGFYIDEYGERQKQQRVAKNIREQENVKVKRLKKPMTAVQIKKRRILASIITCVIVLAIGIVLSLTVLFKTEKIKVEGSSYYSEEEIISYANVALQNNIFIGKIMATPDNIAENLPYVEDARVDVVVPDTIKIKITDAVPAYVIINNGQYLLISSKGRILDVIADNSAKYPILSSSALETATVGSYVSYSDDNVPIILEEISDSISKNEFSGITGIDVNNTASLKLIYDNRIAIILGLPDDIDYKIRTAMAIITEKLDPNKTGAIYGTLDVSSCNTTKTSRFNPNETIAPSTAPVPPAASQIIASEGASNSVTVPASTGVTLATNSDGNFVGDIPATGTDIGNGIVAFDTDGDGIAECFDTDGDGYADVFGSLYSSSDLGSDSDSDTDSDTDTGLDDTDGYNGGEPDEGGLDNYDGADNSYL